MAKFETVTVETDLLICGGGMAACGAAVEASYWAKKNGLKVTVVDKAAIDRSGAVAMGLSAINQYVDLNSGNNTLKDYCDYVRNDATTSWASPARTWLPTLRATWTTPFTCSRSGAFPSGRTSQAITCTRVAGSS
jgi:succinate dehydrogenase/fumarate reductase flavoprotein subunit